MSNSTEFAKELAFGAVAGLCAGYASKKLGSNMVAGAAAASFLVLRGAIFDGQYSAPWSPLAIDDASFAVHLLRKARRETHGTSKRVEIFLKENLVVVGGFAGGVILSVN